MAKTYDQKCYDLAAMFLGDEPEIHTPENIEDLAILIQQTIEDYIAGETSKLVSTPNDDDLLNYRMNKT